MPNRVADGLSMAIVAVNLRTNQTFPRVIRVRGVGQTCRRRRTKAEALSSRRKSCNKFGYPNNFNASGANPLAARVAPLYTVLNSLLIYFETGTEHKNNGYAPPSLRKPYVASCLVQSLPLRTARLVWNRTK